MFSFVSLVFGLLPAWESIVTLQLVRYMPLSLQSSSSCGLEDGNAAGDQLDKCHLCAKYYSYYLETGHSGKLVNIKSWSFVDYSKRNAGSVFKTCCKHWSILSFFKIHWIPSWIFNDPVCHSVKSIELHTVLGRNSCITCKNELLNSRRALSHYFVCSLCHIRGFCHQFSYAKVSLNVIDVDKHGLGCRWSIFTSHIHLESLWFLTLFVGSVLLTPSLAHNS